MQLGRPICKKRIGVIACLLVLLLGLWFSAVVMTYKDHQRVRYEESIVHPGAVTYGTHSIATIPMVSTTHTRSTLPMISGGAIRHYAHSGHATMPSSASSHPVIHTISSAPVKTIGGGGNGGRMGMSSGSSSSSSSRGIRYGGGYSVSMPVFAMETPTYAANRTNALFSDATLTSASGRNGHVRTAMPGGSAEEGTWQNGGDGDWWYYDDGEWKSVNVGDTRYDEFLGYVVVWNGSAWVKVTEYDPKVPIGDVPWLYMLFFCGIICVIRKNIVILCPKS